jgi:transposase-like protein
MNTTYWGWSFGVVVFKDFRTKKILWHKYIRKKETLSDYQEGVDWLANNDFLIEGLVCDGLRGMFQLFSVYPVQMCQFHQVSIVRRYLTKQPELKASKELLSVVKMMSHTDKESFSDLFLDWEMEWSNFLKERSFDKKTGKTRYTHKRLRSAYLSLKRNVKYLWTFSDFDKIGIPNTNNALEGTFTDLKTKLRNHNGLAQNRRKVFIDEYFKGSFK